VAGSLLQRLSVMAIKINMQGFFWISKVGLTGLDRARDAINLVTATVDAPRGS